jgi:hypothetical protein
MQKLSLNARTSGILILITSIILIVWTITFGLIGTQWGFGSGVSLVGMTPFILLTLLRLSILTFAVSIGIKFARNKPFIRNKTFGRIMIFIGAIYFIVQFSTVLFNNISGLNPGGQLRPILAFGWSLITILIGWGMRTPSEGQPAIGST